MPGRYERFLRLYIPVIEPWTIFFKTILLFFRAYIPSYIS